MADIFGGFSDAPHKYDLAWHIRGKLETSLHTDPFEFPSPVAHGYNALTNLTLSDNLGFPRRAIPAWRHDIAAQ